MSANARHSAVVQELRQRLRQMDRSGAQSAKAGALSSTGIAPLDALLPSGAFRSGMIVEWIVEGAGSGAARLALPMVLEALKPPSCGRSPDFRCGRSPDRATGADRRSPCDSTERVAGTGPEGSPPFIESGERLGNRALVVIDERREFYPPAAVSLGLDLDRTIVVRPRNHQETIWALEQALSCAGVAATLGWIDKISDRVFRRFQLAAEHGAGLGVFMRPAEARHEPTWADVRWLVQPVPADADSSGRRVRVELLHCRGGTGGGAVTLEISDETGAVFMVPPLAAPANLPRAAGA
jgi:hypothetical protein